MTDRSEDGRSGGRDLVPIAVLPNEAAAAALGEAFEYEGVVFRFTPAYDTQPAFGVSVGTPVRVLVSPEDVVFAKRLIDESASAGDGVDWEATDVGEPEDAVAARIAGRDDDQESGFPRTDDEADAVMRAKRQRKLGFAVLAIGIGFAFAAFGYTQVLFAVLAIIAVLAGRAHAIRRKRRKIERAFAAHDDGSSPHA